MKNFKQANKEIAERLINLPYQHGDVSDIGNEIGIVIAKYFDEDNDIENFIFGIKHGISLTDGTHGPCDARIVITMIDIIKSKAPKFNVGDIIRCHEHNYGEWLCVIQSRNISENGRLWYQSGCEKMWNESIMFPASDHEKTILGNLTFYYLKEPELPF